MVETILFNLASKVVEKIGFLPLREVGLAWGVEEELKTLEGTLSTVKAVLLDAERQYNQAPQGYYSNAMGVWFERLQAAFYEADNVLDEFQYEALRRQVLRMNGMSIGIQVHKFFSGSHTIAFRFRFKMRCKIKEIRKRLDMIADDRTKFHLFTTSTHTISTSISSLVNESDFVGRHDDRERIFELLMTSSLVEKISVIPIVGMGGLGKTTLVKLLYNNKVVVGHFELRIWVRVAQEFNVKHVMQKIIQSVIDSNTDNLHAVLQEKLGDKRILLVLDDVCNCDNRDWIKFFKFLRGCANGSKIVVTTRNKSVASTVAVATVPVYNLESLSDENCHELLLKWAGSEKVGEQHGNQLSEISKEIVKKCHRNPLAAKTLGNNLFMKTDESDWLHLNEKELWELVQKKHDILAVLRLSYNPLPANLKHCFIYCSIFPKNYEIEIDKLKQLWMAQGFIQIGLNHELEDIATEYLNQLCSLFLLEKTEEHHENLLNICRMPEIVRDLAIFMANEECLSTEYYHFGLNSERVKHVSFHDFDCLREEVTKSLFTLKSLQTVFFPFHGVGVGGEHFVDKCNLRFKHLHVLDLSNSCFRVLPDSIGNLKHLRFLELSWNANIETLPDTICKLYNLQTLRIWYCFKIGSCPKTLGT